MFDGSLPEIGDVAAAEDDAVVDAAAGWARVEAAACARKLAAMAELFCRRTGLDSAEERECWWVDPCAAVAAELGAAQGISRGLALAQAHRGVALRDRLPKIAELFAAGQISDLLVRAIVWRTWLIQDPEAMACVDFALAAQVTRWGALSVKKTEQAIDALVDEHDPGALRRSRAASQARDVVIGSPTDEAGFTSLWARLYAPDGAALERRLEAMARSVCADDPRTMAERRADALGALAAGQDKLPCECGGATCTAGEARAVPNNVVIHVLADAATVAAASSKPSAGSPKWSVASVVGRPTPPPAEPVAAPPPAAPPSGPEASKSSSAATGFVVGEGLAPTPLLAALMERPSALPTEPPTSESPPATPGFIIGGGVVPAPMLTSLMERATIRPLRHPGDAPPEPRYVPSRATADLVRCRDLTCRFPNCDRPADVCDIDHTVPYPYGPTHPSNLKCLCRFH